MTRLRALYDRLSAATLDGFNRWFVSDAGVVQTFVAAVAFVVVERLFPGLDHGGFWLLYWLTVYSAVTQPALARAGRVAAERQGEILDRIASLEEEIARSLRPRGGVETR